MVGVQKRKEKCLGGHRQRTRSTQSKDVLMICCLRLAFTLHVLHSAVSVEDLSKTAFEIGDSFFIFSKDVCHERSNDNEIADLASHHGTSRGKESCIL